MKFQALLYFVLSMFGCDVGRSTFVDRIVHVPNPFKHIEQRTVRQRDEEVA